MTSGCAQRIDTFGGSKGKDGEKEGSWPRAVPGGPYHFAQVDGQFFHDHTESSELLEYAGDVFARQTTDLSRLDIWTREKRKKKQTVNDFIF